ncbi:MULTISPECIES: hypothetical protein [Sphingomonas]|uniref:tRNA nuclease CdiA C-terminal domain-containing protein n=1 Tax=Sphingomonas trueperi TaxID=53317 RepID=A0A7X5XYU9_9SPHN|nr:hypothetical protein [Sphingomonas sp. ABOLD]NJB96351.1 hypothetical protein [Sphingomonas trueperi]
MTFLAGGGVYGPGRLFGSVDGLTSAEKSFVNDLIVAGRTVEIIPTSTNRTVDFIIDGVSYELKTVNNIANKTIDGISKSISSTIMDARGQSGNIIIDARGQDGMTKYVAYRAIGRAYGADRKLKIQNITIITSEGEISVPRIK